MTAKVDLRHTCKVCWSNDCTTTFVVKSLRLHQVCLKSMLQMCTTTALSCLML